MNPPSPLAAPASPRIHVTLPTRTVFAVPDGAGVGIECRSGSVWLTLDRDRRDFILEAGQRFDGTEHRRVLVSALTSSCITVSNAQAVTLPLKKTKTRAASPWRLRGHGLSPA